MATVRTAQMQELGCWGAVVGAAAAEGQPAAEAMAAAAADSAAAILWQVATMTKVRWAQPSWERVLMMQTKPGSKS